MLLVATVGFGSWAFYTHAQTSPAHPRIIAHRGGPDSFGPESIIPTFVKAAKAGYDIELDVRFAKANAQGRRTPWIMHDWALDRTTNCKGGLTNHTDAELLKCKVTAKDRIPTLYEALKAIHAANPKVRVVIHIQPDDMRQVDALAVGDRVRWTGMQSHVIIMSWLAKHLAYFKAEEPTLPRLRIFLKGTSWYSDPNAQGILVDISELSAAKVNEAKARGFTVYGSADDPAGYKILQNAGVYGNFCDNPVAYDKWLKASAAR